MKLLTEHTDRIKELGYTDTEARFLYIVAVHSGYFTLGQFRAFTGAGYGKRPTAFARKLLTRGHAAIRDHTRRGSVFHLFSRTVYGQIEKDNLRNRKRHSFDFMRTRLVLLDFILQHQEFDYLETERGKVSLFCEKLGVPKECLPAKAYAGRPGSPPTVRYFVDKFPFFLASPFSGASPVVTFSYVDSGFEKLASFPTHLATYQSLFQHLQTFRFAYIAPKEAFFPRAKERFQALVKTPLESEASSEVLRYFEIRQKCENHEYVIPVTQDLVFLKEARQRFQGEPFEGLYQAWSAGELGADGLRAELARLSPDRTVFFDGHLVRSDRFLVAVEPSQGDGCMKEADHCACNPGRHRPDGAKLIGR
jgi:hypothetical protein